jgi:uncharacterized protein DUF3558
MPKPHVIAAGLFCATVLSATAACGPDQPTSQPTSQPAAAPSAATTAAQQPASTGVTPDQVCALVTTAQMAQATNFTIVSATPKTSGDVSVCDYGGHAADTTNLSSKVIIEYSPNGKTAVEFTKARGEAVPGLGQFAVYFSTSASIDVEVGGQATFHVYVEDVRAGNGDPKEACVEIAQIAVPRLMH